MRFEGQEVTTLGPAALRSVRRRMQVIFQDPDPLTRMTVSQIVGEPLGVHALIQGVTGREARVRQLLGQVGLLPQHGRRHPGRPSGAMHRRVGIARALALQPA